MKLTFSLFLGLILSTWAIGQNDYKVDIKHESVSTKSAPSIFAKRELLGKCKFNYTFNFQEGDRFIFEDIGNDSLSFWELDGYYLTKEGKKNENRRAKLLQKDYAGKIVKIVKIEDKKNDGMPETDFDFEVEGTGELISLKKMFSRKDERESLANDGYYNQLYTLDYLIYLADIDSLKANYLNKTFYTKFILLSRLKQYQPVKVIKVGAGSIYAPIRIVFQDSSGRQSYQDVCTCGNNLTTAFSDLHYFENFFSLTNPKDDFKGSDETWDLITQLRIKIGMTEEELILSWGNPIKINETVVSGRVSKQYVYDNNKYAYFENGLVSSFQLSR